MPITKGAEKAHKASLKKRVFNVRRTRAMNTAITAVRTHLKAGDTAAAEAALPTAYKAIDKAAKRGIIKSNTADRKKGRLSGAIVRGKSQ